MSRYCTKVTLFVKMSRYCTKNTLFFEKGNETCKGVLSVNRNSFGLLFVSLPYIASVVSNIYMFLELVFFLQIPMSLELLNNSLVLIFDVFCVGFIQVFCINLLFWFPWFWLYCEIQKWIIIVREVLKTNGKKAGVEQTCKVWQSIKKAKQRKTKQKKTNTRLITVCYL